MKHHKNKVIIALLALLLAAGVSLTACTAPTDDPQTDQTTPPSQTNDANTDPSVEVPQMLAETDALALVQEKLDKQYSLKAIGLIDETGKSVSSSEVKEGTNYYFAWDVQDPDQKKIGGIAVDSVSGELFNYDSEKKDSTITPYENFPLYDAATDAVEDWNGTFANGSLTVELLQEDPSSVDFEFSDAMEGTARVEGNTASYNDGELVFSFRDGSLIIKGKSTTHAGTYTPASSSAP